MYLGHALLLSCSLKLLLGMGNAVGSRSTCFRSHLANRRLVILLVLYINIS